MTKNNVIPIKIEPEIFQFFHCAMCLEDKPDGIAPREWSLIECGWTKQGFQVWCRRHNCNVIHVDFEGVIHKTI